MSGKAFFSLYGQFSCFQVVAACPHLFPMLFAQCLVEIAADKSQEQDRLGRVLSTITSSHAVIRLAVNEINTDPKFQNASCYIMCL